MARLIHQHVGRLHIAVHHALGMGVGQRVQQLGHDLQRLRQREAVAAAEELGQFTAGDELHHDVRQVIVFAEVVHRDDVRV